MCKLGTVLCGPRVWLQHSVLEPDTNLMCKLGTVLYGPRVWLQHSLLEPETRMRIPTSRWRAARVDGVPGHVVGTKVAKQE